MKASLLAAALVVPLAFGAAAAGPGVAAPLPQTSSCSGVWVVVDYGSLGGTSTRCATRYGTGVAALKSAGFSVTLDDSFVYKLDGKPSNPNVNKAYWSYWHATRAEDGSYSNWVYSSLGADAYQPTKGNAEGWRYQSLSDGKVRPSVSPPRVSTPSPTPTRTTTKPKPKPKPKPTATASKAATPKVNPTVSGGTSRTASASAKATASAPAKATATATGTTAESPTPSPIEQVTVVAQDQVSAPEPTSGSGSPVGVIVAGSAVLAAGAGLGGWWLWRGRKR